MKFKDFQAPVLFSSTFKVLNLGEKNSKDAWEPCINVTVCMQSMHRSTNDRQVKHFSRDWAFDCMPPSENVCDLDL